MLYKDVSMEGKVGQWQKLCAECASQPENSSWPRRQGSDDVAGTTCATSAATSACGPAGPSQSAQQQQQGELGEWGLEEEAELQTLLGSSRSPGKVTSARATNAPTAAPAADKELCERCGKIGLCACFMRHDDERALGKGLWAEVAARMPRGQHDGRLAMPNGGKAVDLKQLALDFPSLPYI